MTAAARVARATKDFMVAGGWVGGVGKGVGMGIMGMVRIEELASDCCFLYTLMDAEE